MKLLIKKKHLVKPAVLLLTLLFIGIGTACSKNKNIHKNTSTSQKQTVKQKPLWSKISGRWKLDKEKNLLIETLGRTRNIGYSELINYNSIITKKRFEKYNKIYLNYKVLKNIKQPVSHLIVFGAKDFRNFYALRLTGDGNEFSQISLIGSKTKNPSLHRWKKWNFTITEYKTRKCKLDLKKDLKFKLVIHKNTIKVYLKKKKIAYFKLPEPIINVRIALSNRNTILALDNITVYNKKNLLFKDDFSSNTIHRYGKNLKIKKVKKK